MNNAPRFGYIYLVSFGHGRGNEISKTRPALVVQSDKNPNNSPLHTVLPLTSQLSNASGPHDIFVSKNNENRLFCNSLLCVSQVFTFDSSRFLHEIGRIDTSVLSAVQTYLRKHFDL